jgi:hypothetical protein
MSRHFWRWYADRQFHKWEKTVVWDMVEPYRPPRSFAPLVGTYVAAFYTGVVGAAVTEQLYKVSQPHHLGSSILPWPSLLSLRPPALQCPSGARWNACPGNHTRPPRFLAHSSTVVMRRLRFCVLLEINMILPHSVLEEFLAVKL